MKILGHESHEKDWGEKDKKSIMECTSNREELGRVGEFG